MNSSAFPADIKSSVSLAKAPFLQIPLECPGESEVSSPTWAPLLQGTATVLACAEIAGSAQHPEMLRGHQCVAGTPPHNNQAVWQPQGTDADHGVRAKRTAACPGRRSLLCSARPDPPAACTAGCPSSCSLSQGFSLLFSLPAPTGSALCFCSARTRSGRNTANCMLTGSPP